MKELEEEGQIEDGKSAERIQPRADKVVEESAVEDTRPHITPSEGIGASSPGLRIGPAASAHAGAQVLLLSLRNNCRPTSPSHPSPITVRIATCQSMDACHL